MRKEILMKQMCLWVEITVEKESRKVKYWGWGKMGAGNGHKLWGGH